MATTVKSSKSNTSEKIVSPVSVAENYFDNWLKVFPNPNNGSFTIQSTISKIESMEIFNIYGQKVYSQIINSKLYAAHAELPNGVYFVKLISEKGVSVKKITIDR